jgi:hypothetical protein
MVAREAPGVKQLAGAVGMAVMEVIAVLILQGLVVPAGVPATEAMQQEGKVVKVERVAMVGKKVTILRSWLLETVEMEEMEAREKVEKEAVGVTVEMACQMAEAVALRSPGVAEIQVRVVPVVLAA